MITIKQPNIRIIDGKARLFADLDVDGLKTQLWFEVDEEYKDYLLHERIDAFVLGLFHEAIRKNHDIVSEAPMTKRLYFQLTNQFLPAYFKLNGGNFKIICPLADEVVHPNGGTAIGTGVSCGVDSLHVFANHPEITHACIWNLHGVTHNETSEIRQKGWENLINVATKFTSEIGCKLIVGNTNFDRGCLPSIKHDGSTTYSNLFCIMALQKLWSQYFVASGYDIGDFKLKATYSSDPAHYEYLLFSFCGLNNLGVYMDGVAQTRIEKVGDLIKYSPAYKHLNVCFGILDDGTNCTYKCAKCMRTLLNLEAWGAVELFKDVFDVDYYYSHPEEYLAELWRGYIQKNPFALEMRPYLKNKKWPFVIKIKAMVIVLKKGVRKLIRFGRISQGEFKSR